MKNYILLNKKGPGQAKLGIIQFLISQLFRISLLYCRAKFQRKGCGTKLLHKLEDEAKREGLDFLSTEASMISYRLFLKNEWKIIRKEKVIINNIFFERYKMTKIIKVN